jgi:hypothetical protein
MILFHSLTSFWSWTSIGVGLTFGYWQSWASKLSVLESLALLLPTQECLNYMKTCSALRPMLWIERVCARNWDKRRRFRKTTETIRNHRVLVVVKTTAAQECAGMVLKPQAVQCMSCHPRATEWLKDAELLDADCLSMAFFHSAYLRLHFLNDRPMLKMSIQQTRNDFCL